MDKFNDSISNLEKTNTILVKSSECYECWGSTKNNSLDKDRRSILILIKEKIKDWVADW